MPRGAPRPLHCVDIPQRSNLFVPCNQTNLNYLDKTTFIVFISSMMKLTSVALSLAALGHDARLAIFRLLVRAGDDGLNIGEVVAHLDMAPSTLAYHLKTLVDAGLVKQERQGRHIVNRVDFAVMNETVSFLTSECCAGVKLIEEDAA